MDRSTLPHAARRLPPRPRNDDLQRLRHVPGPSTVPVARPVHVRFQPSQAVRPADRPAAADPFDPRRASGRGGGNGTLPHPQAGRAELVLRRPLRQVGRGAAAARPQGLYRGLLRLPLARPHPLPQPRRHRLQRRAGEVLRGQVRGDGPEPQCQRRDVPAPRPADRPLPGALSQHERRQGRQWWRLSAQPVADGQGARAGARLSDLHLRHRHDVCRERARTTSIRC